jgi:mycoredoxin-dependent peroxiredoxin
MSLIIGDHAPDFELVNQYGETVKLSDFRGKKPVVVVFYPLSFSGICTGELCEIRDNFAKFEKEDVELLAISVDSKFVQKQFAEHEGYKFSVLADLRCQQGWRASGQVCYRTWTGTQPRRVRPSFS